MKDAQGRRAGLEHVVSPPALGEMRARSWTEGACAPAPGPAASSAGAAVGRACRAPTVPALPRAGGRSAQLAHPRQVALLPPLPPRRAPGLVSCAGMTSLGSRRIGRRRRWRGARAANFFHRLAGSAGRWARHARPTGGRLRAAADQELERKHPLSKIAGRGISRGLAGLERRARDPHAGPGRPHPVLQQETGGRAVLSRPRPLPGAVMTTTW